MAIVEQSRRTQIGALWAVIAMLCFTASDVIVKFLSDDFPLYELLFLRSLIGLAFVFVFFVPASGGLTSIRTNRLPMHLARGLCVLMANFFFLMSLAAMPLAEAVAIFFISPLLISVMSVVFLGEHVGPRRWTAIVVGLIGVLIVVRPGTSAFQVASLLPLAAALCYSGLHILTRHIGDTENATAMVFYIQLTLATVAAFVGLAMGDGRFDLFDHPSLEFLFRAWTIPDVTALLLIVGIGILSSIGGLTVSEAYRNSEPAYVAPFEYLALPMSVFWGFTVFGEWPDRWAWSGMMLILTSGLVLIWLEARARRRGEQLPSKTGSD